MPGIVISYGAGILFEWITESSYIGFITCVVVLLIYFICGMTLLYRYKTKDQREMRKYIDKKLNKHN